MKTTWATDYNTGCWPHPRISSSGKSGRRAPEFAFLTNPLVKLTQKHCLGHNLTVLRGKLGAAATQSFGSVPRVTVLKSVSALLLIVLPEGGMPPSVSSFPSCSCLLPLSPGYSYLLLQEGFLDPRSLICSPNALPINSSRHRLCISRLAFHMSTSDTRQECDLLLRTGAVSDYSFHHKHKAWYIKGT